MNTKRAAPSKGRGAKSAASRAVITVDPVANDPDAPSADVAAPDATVAEDATAADATVAMGMTRPPDPVPHDASATNGDGALNGHAHTNGAAANGTAAATADAALPAVPAPATPAAPAANPYGHFPFAPSPTHPSGWYPDVDDTGSLRFWDGHSWTDHRARLATPAVPVPIATHPIAPAPYPAHYTPAPYPSQYAHQQFGSFAPVMPAATCECGVVAAGSCRVCSRAFCRAHISEQAIEDRAFLLRWEAWTCVHCLESDQRRARARQLARCEDVHTQLARIRKISRLRTVTGLKPPLVNVLTRGELPGQRPVRLAQAHLIEFDGGEPDSTNLGLAVSADGETVYDVGAKMAGVASGRGGPKMALKGYMIRKAITIDALREAAARPTRDNWFEFGARAYLRAAKRLGLAPLETDD